MEHAFLVGVTKRVVVVWMEVVVGLVEGIRAHGRRRFRILVFQEVQLVDELCGQRSKRKSDTRATEGETNNSHKNNEGPKIKGGTKNICTLE